MRLVSEGNLSNHFFNIDRIKSNYLSLFSEPIQILKTIQKVSIGNRAEKFLLITGTYSM